MPDLPSHTIFPLGDSALTIDFGNVIDKQLNQKVLLLFQHLRAHPIPGMIESLPAYNSLTIYYDAFQLHKQFPENKTVYDWMAGQVEERLQGLPQDTVLSTRNIEIPVCYEGEYAPDLTAFATLKKISVEELVHIHTSATYRVYMLGFLPGFAYMGEVDDRIIAPRKQQPGKVEAGSVGIAGKQTGIYPLSSPGGWQIIGRTPLKLFNPHPDIQMSEAGSLENSLCLLQPGDEVRFYSISQDEFKDH